MINSMELRAELSDMRVLVTGGAGFIGSNLVEELLRRRASVRVLDNFSTGKRENLTGFREDIELIEGDVRSFHIVQQAVSNIDVVFHQAALPSVPRSIRDAITSNEVNTTGTLNVLEASRISGVAKVVFASSSSIYGDNPELPKREHHIPNPLSPYAVSKLAGEHYCRVYSKIYGLKTVALRYFNVFGPRQDPNSQYSAVIPRFIEAALSKKRPIIYGDGDQSRDFTYVANVIEANLRAATMECEGGVVLNCACGERKSLNELVDRIGALSHQNLEPIYQEARPGDIRHSMADITRARSELLYEPRISFDKGLQLTLDSVAKTSSKRATRREVVIA